MKDADGEEIFSQKGPPRFLTSSELRPLDEAFSIIVEEKAFDQVYVVLAGRVSMENAERVRSALVES